MVHVHLVVLTAIHWTCVAREKAQSLTACSFVKFRFSSELHPTLDLLSGIIPAAASKERPAMDRDSLSDDVFEEDGHPNPNFIYHNNDGLNVNEPLLDDKTPSPTHGYPGFKPPKKALRMYALATDYFQEKKDPRESRASVGSGDDDWTSYRIEDDNTFDETVVHKVGFVSWISLSINTFLKSMYGCWGIRGNMDTRCCWDYRTHAFRTGLHCVIGLY